MSDRVRFLRYRNDSGEVIVAYKENENIPGFHAGYAFCNPCDFNLPRKVRLAKGHGLATWRMRNYAVPIPPFAPETAEEYTHHMFRKHMLEFAVDNLEEVGVKPYRGENGNFVEWFPSFVEQERKKHDDQGLRHV